MTDEDTDTAPPVLTSPVLTSPADAGPLDVPTDQPRPPEPPVIDDRFDPTFHHRGLGLVCLSYTGECRFRTTTRARYLKLSPAEQADLLRSIYWDNVQKLHWTLGFCARRGIRLYRATSALFPMSDEPTGGRVLRSMAASLASVGRRAERLGIRVVLHPDQFVVLSSKSRKIAATSRKILEKHALAFDLMGLSATPWNLMNIHGGLGDRTEPLVRAIDRLPDNVRGRLTLENDEYTYGAAEILDVCHRTGIPFVFDCHHHVIKAGLDSYHHPSCEFFTKEAATTWPDPSHQLVHVSNGGSAFLDRNHSQYITALPRAYRDVPWVEVEARGKEFAVARLRAAWPDAPTPTQHVEKGAAAGDDQ